MKRRTVLLGVGGTVAGSGALAGSGAFTTGTLEDRAAVIPVAADSEGNFRLFSGPDQGMVRENPETHRLEIDFQQFVEQDYAGANVGAEFWLGDDADPTNSYAFGMENRSGSDLDVTFDYQVDDESNNDPYESALEFQIFDDVGDLRATHRAPNSTTTFGMDEGETLYIVLLVDSTNGLTANDLSGALTIHAVGTS